MAIGYWLLDILPTRERGQFPIPNNQLNLPWEGYFLKILPHIPKHQIICMQDELGSAVKILETADFNSIVVIQRAARVREPLTLLKFIIRPHAREPLLHSIES